ncbi:MAG: hypothetical protein EHM39_13940, partial [Chloroflexi bacterium]
MGEPNINDIRYSLDLIRSTRPEDRTRGIAILSQMKHDPRVIEVFQLLYRDDPDPGVRAAARDALYPQGISAPLPVIRAPTAVEAPPREAPARGPFLVNPANASLVSRYARRPRRRRRIILAMVALALLLAGVFWGLVLPDWWRWYQLNEKGVTTQAVITSLQEQGNGRHVVTYRF